jgi:lysyl-tRNA synthetase class 2
MKPENRAVGELTRTEGSSNKALELTEDEKVLMNILKANSPIDLNELKGQTGLSNKKWDKAIKGLTKNKLAKVEKTDAGLLVSLA